MDNIPISTTKKIFKKIRWYKEAYLNDTTTLDIEKSVKLLRKTYKQHRAAHKL